MKSQTSMLIEISSRLDLLCDNNDLRISIFIYCKQPPQEKMTDSHFWIFRVFKEYPQKSKFGRVGQIPIRELGWEFPDWDMSHFAKFGIFVSIL